MDAFLNLGNCWYFMHEYDRAIDYYDRCVESNPGYASAYTNRGNARSSMGEYIAAETDYSLAIALSPQQAVVVHQPRKFVVRLG